jgi:hypothetical protein
VKQQQRTDVRAVHVGVGHDDDAAVTQLRDVEVVRARRAADAATPMPVPNAVIKGLLLVSSFS